MEIKFPNLSRRETAAIKEDLENALVDSSLFKKYTCGADVIGLQDGLRLLAKLGSCKLFFNALANADQPGSHED